MKTIQENGKEFILSQDYDVEVDFEDMYNDTSKKDVLNTEENKEVLTSSESSELVIPTFLPIIHLNFSTDTASIELAGNLKFYKKSKKLIIKCESITEILLEILKNQFDESFHLTSFNIYYNDKTIKHKETFILNSFNIIEFKEEVSLCELIFVKKRTN